MTPLSTNEFSLVKFCQRRIFAANQPRRVTGLCYPAHGETLYAGHIVNSSSFPKMVSDWVEVVVVEAAEAAPQGRRKTSRPNRWANYLRG